MIQNSFIFLDRIGNRLEKSLWKMGVHDWELFQRRQSIPGVSCYRKGFYDRKLIEAQKALYNFDAAYFKHIMPSSEQYRLYDFFKDEAVFLDIETSGLSPYYSDVTVVGLYDGIDTKMMIKGINLDHEALKKELEKYKLIITFNGASFDLPFLEKCFPNTIPSIPHIDLRPVMKRIGYSGGLKKIERDLNIQRRELVADLDGGDALTLWRSYKASGDEYYLNLLIEYNEEDIINLKKIADFGTKELKKQLMQEILVENGGQQKTINVEHFPRGRA